MEGLTRHRARQFRLIFADVDGTLVNDAGVLTPRTVAAVQRVREQERTLVLCTGRSRHAAHRVAEALGGEGYGIVLNGAVVLDWHSGKVLRRTLVPARIVRCATEIARRHSLATVWLRTEERDKRQYADSTHPLWPVYEERNRARLEYTKDLAAVAEASASLAAYGTEEQAAALAQAWQRELGSEAHAVAGPTAAYCAWYAQLTAPDATKSSAAAFLAEYLDIPREQTVAIGDHENDVGLIKWAGLGICMGDGHPAALAAADFVTGTLSEDGAALALESLTLD